MGSLNSVELAVCRSSAWAPGLTDEASWRDWAHGKREMAGEAAPDVRFVEPMLRRRLSFLSRIAFRVAADCLEGESPSPVCLFCSRYGEIVRSTEILKAIAAGEPVAPASFSLSVHNTSSSLLSIARHDTAPWIALSGGEATLETAFLEAWNLLKEGPATSVLLVYHDEKLPPPLETQITTITQSVAFALLLRLPEAALDRLVLKLEWRPSRPGPSASLPSHLDVLRLLLVRGEPAVLKTGRLDWIWSARAAKD